MVFYLQWKTKQNITQSKSNPIKIPSHDTMITRVTQSQFRSNPTMIPIPIPNLIRMQYPIKSEKAIAYQRVKQKKRGCTKQMTFFGFFGFMWGRGQRGKQNKKANDDCDA